MTENDRIYWNISENVRIMSENVSVACLGGPYMISTFEYNICCIGVSKKRYISLILFVCASE